MCYGTPSDVAMLLCDGSSRDDTDPYHARRRECGECSFSVNPQVRVATARTFRKTGRCITLETH